MAITSTGSYDPNGNTISQTEITQTVGQPQQTHTYTATLNTNDWVTSSSDDGLITNYGYDAAAQERTQTIIDGNTPVTTVLDLEGRATAIGENVGGAGPYTSTFGYNLNDLPVTETLPGSVNVSSQYDPDSRLTHYSTLGPTGATTPLSSTYDFGYNAIGWITALTSSIGSGVGAVTPMTYTHDSLGRLIQWQGQQNGPETWGYDGNGNIISTTSFINGAVNTTVYTYSATQPSELIQQHTTTLGVDTYSYDGQGNVISEVSTDAIANPYYVNQHFSGDALERPVTVTNVMNQATVMATLGYNPAGQNITYTMVMSGQVIDNALYSYDSGGNLAQTITTTATLSPDGSIKSSGAYTTPMPMTLWVSRSSRDASIRDGGRGRGYAGNAVDSALQASRSGGAPLRQ